MRHIKLDMHIKLIHTYTWMQNLLVLEIKFEVSPVDALSKIRNEKRTFSLSRFFPLISSLCSLI